MKDEHRGLFVEAKLIENVQFIYELALAQLELESFDIKFSMNNNLRKFLLNGTFNEDLLTKRLAYFKRIGETPTDYYQLTRYNITRSINQYLTHWIYPYKGKFHPQMIRAILNIMRLRPGNTVLDPFMGSGTTILEAQLLGINSIGIDISPLCVLQSKVKVQSHEVLDQIIDLSDEAVESFCAKRGKDTLIEDHRLRYSEFLTSIHNEKIRNFFKMAELIAISDEVRRHRDISKSFIKNLDRMKTSIELYANAVNKLDLPLGKVDIREADARKSSIEDRSIDGIVTSPPYSIALDYISNDEHALNALECDLAKQRDKLIGVRGKGEEKINLYNEDMTRSFKEMHRVLRNDGYCVIVIGNATYGNHKINTIEYTIKECQKLGFKLLKNINKIIFGIYNVMQTDNTLIFVKEP